MQLRAFPVIGSLGITSIKHSDPPESDGRELVGGAWARERRPEQR